MNTNPLRTIFGAVVRRIRCAFGAGQDNLGSRSNLGLKSNGPYRRPEYDASTGTTRWLEADSRDSDKVHAWALTHFKDDKLKNSIRWYPIETSANCLTEHSWGKSEDGAVDYFRKETDFKTKEVAWSKLDRKEQFLVFMFGFNAPLQWQSCDEPKIEGGFKSSGDGNGQRQ